MTRHGSAHRWYRFCKFCNAAKLTKLLRACVALVIEVLPATRVVFTDRLHPSIRGGIDEHLRPRGWNFQIVNSVEISFRETAVLRLVTKAAFGSAESTYADVLQTLDVCHGNE